MLFRSLWFLQIKYGLTLDLGLVAFDYESDDFRVSVLPNLSRLPILNFSVHRLQKRTSRLRPRCENTWNEPKIRRDRSPEELDRSGQTEG